MACFCCRRINTTTSLVVLFHLPRAERFVRHALLAEPAFLDLHRGGFFYPSLGNSEEMVNSTFPPSATRSSPSPPARSGIPSHHGRVPRKGRRVTESRHRVAGAPCCALRYPPHPGQSLLEGHLGAAGPPSRHSWLRGYLLLLVDCCVRGRTPTQDNSDNFLYVSQ